MKVKIYDTTLRDGAQAEGISFSLLDKIMIAQELDRLGVHYIEGGWPGSNPKDEEFFRRVKKLKFSKAKIAAFGSTRKAEKKTEKDAGILSLLRAETPVVAVFGKSWTLHVEKALSTTREENLRMIEETVRFLKEEGREVIFDAEHFFDGFKTDPEYALKTLEVAWEGGADLLVLCDTNGGSLPFEVEEIIKKVREKKNYPLGFHAHNDSGMAVANSIVAVRCGVTHLQGTINGYGERCGNADLCVLIPNLKLKLRIDCLSEEELKYLTHISRLVSEVANVPPNDHQPYVGRAAFAHKGGVHVSAVRKDTRTYEHIDPVLVGNERRVLVSELAGRSTILYKLGKKVGKDSHLPKRIIERVKNLENRGYQFEGAEGSFQLLVKKVTGEYKKLFDFEGFRVIVEKREDGRLISEATVKLRLKKKIVHTVAEGNGPVHALDQALRKALEKAFPELKEMHLADYKVRILDPGKATAAKTRVLIESRDREDRWGTVGVSPNIIEASWEALLDSIEYKLLKERERKKS